MALPLECTASPPSLYLHTNCFLENKAGKEEVLLHQGRKRGENNGITHRLAQKKPQEGLCHHHSKARCVTQTDSAGKGQACRSAPPLSTFFILENFCLYLDIQIQEPKILTVAEHLLYQYT